MRKFISLRRLSGILLFTLAAFTAADGFAEEAWSLLRLHSFGNPTQSAHHASYGMILAHDGKLYGTTFGGGPRGGGIVFRVNKDGRNFEIIHDFASQYVNSGGTGPAGNVAEASDGKLYGATIGGGIYGAGTIFRLNPDGSDFEVIHNFQATEDSGGQNPQDKLIEGTDGKLYGVTQYGGNFDSGTIYRINKDGSGFEELHEFDWQKGEGYWPKSALLQGSDGILYGTLAEGEEIEDAGKIFKINPDGTGYEIIHDFGSHAGDGANPIWSLAEGPDGALYGSTPLGGPLTGGVIFKLRKDGSHYQVLQSFSEKRFTLGVPFGPMRLSSDGTLYGTTRYGGRPFDAGSVYSLRRGGAEFRVVGYFRGGSRDVAFPSGELAQDDAGNFFGSSLRGGPANEGTLFRWNPAGNDAALHSFNSTGGDGGRADSQLALGTDGSLYGTTSRGGEFGKGTVFRINADGSGYKILRSLQDTPVGVIADSAGSDLFFTTSTGLLRMKSNGSLKSLHVFHGSNKDGSSPGVPLEGSDGMLYGIAQAGGQAGYGAIYSINKNGSDYRVLYHHPAPTNIFDPPDYLNTYLLEGSDGALYGTTEKLTLGIATVFKVNKDGTGFVTLHSFDANNTNGRLLRGRLMEGSDGLIYGTMDNTFPCVVYAMNKDGSGFKIVYTFGVAGLVTGVTEGNDGALYGMASSNSGAVFRLTKAGDEFSILANAGPSDTEASLVKLPDGSFCETTTRSGDMDLGQVFRVLPTPNVNVLLSKEVPRSRD
jgi:uncharacterized repeat protein (TIGR03803 family)